MKRYKAYENEDTREAAALKYDAERERAPRVTALGKGYMAQRMVKEAQRHQVEVVRDQKLSHALHQLNVGDEIPEALYRVVAEILALVYRMDRKRGQGLGTPGTDRD